MTMTDEGGAGWCVINRMRKAAHEHAHIRQGMSATCRLSG
jgi:hypothetical protein